MVPASTLFFAFAVTVIIEGVVIAISLGRRQRLFFIAAVVLVVHMVTHPLGAVAFYIFNTPLLVVELLVVVLEAILYWRVFPISILKAAPISFFANLASFLLGPIIRAVFFVN